MNQRKTNNTLWYSLGLAALVLVAFLGSVAGPALARYRTQEKLAITFQIRPPAKVCLGTMQIPEATEAAEGSETSQLTEEEPDAVFVPDAIPAWTEVEGEKLQLRLAIANGTSETDFSEKGQYVKFRLFGSLGLWSGGETPKITVLATYGSEVVELQGKVTYVDDGSVLFSTHGNGWIYTFHIPSEAPETEMEEEHTWLLPGGDFRYVDLLITMDSGDVNHSSLLQPQIISELITQ